MSSHTLKAVAAQLQDAVNPLVMTGAGVSAESGIATFRDAQEGLWAKYSPQDLATPEAFRRDPDTVWQWYQWRRSQIRNAQPNAGHIALAGLQKLNNNLTLITQNVDGLHQRAGSTDVIEFHGNIFRNRCLEENTPALMNYEDLTSPPPCTHCGALVRPDVIWFGEGLDPSVVNTSFEAASACDVFLSIGTSSLVYPAADLAFHALQSGATLIEINPSETPLSPHCHHVITGKAAEVLPAIIDLLPSNPEICD